MTPPRLFQQARLMHGFRLFQEHPDAADDPMGILEWAAEAARVGVHDLLMFAAHLDQAHYDGDVIPYWHKRGYP